MPGSENDIKTKIALGKKLYFEKRLSKNNTQSCNSCHNLDNGKNGVDNQPTSKGAFGKRGGRNSPTVWNAGLHIAQFWDGRASDLKAQAKGPILNPIEMAMSSEKAVIDKLGKIKEYPALFKAAFPKASNALTYDNLAEAIAAFERTLITRDRLDKFISGDAKALSQKEQIGLDKFIATGCVACHSGNLLGGRSYMKMGLANKYENIQDFGRYSVTEKDEDRYKFKVPSLRNIANTAPYFHDGKAKTLGDAVTQMAWLQLGKKLSTNDISSIVTFLTALNKIN